MIVVEFRRPTLDARVYEVAATATVHDDGTLTATGDMSVVPAYAMAGRGYSATATADAWLAQLGMTPETLFVIPVIVNRNGVPVTDPHATAPDAAARQKVDRQRNDGSSHRSPGWEHRRPRTPWRKAGRGDRT
jgi:hypothetical protein